MSLGMSAGPTVVIKIGGATMQDASLVTSLARDLVAVKKMFPRLVLVHGGGPLINEELTRRGITWEFFEGQRITTPQMMGVIESVLSGTVNKSVVHELNRAGGRAAGFSGVDGPTLLCQRADERLGQVGVVKGVQTDLIESCLSAGLTPVMAPVGWGEGHALNVNADWAATSVATALKASKLLFLTDQDGVLDAEKKVRHGLSKRDMQELIDSKVIHGGMLAKIRTVIHALDHGIENVVIANARTPMILSHLLESNRRHGTWCRE